MDADRYYNIETFLKNALTKDWLDLISYCNAESSRAEAAIRRAKRNDPDEYIYRKYYDFVHEATYFFTMGGVPAAMPKRDFQRLKPIVEHLVELKQWKADSLQSFESEPI